MTGQEVVNVVAVAAFGLSVVSLWLTHRDSTWKRRHVVMERLRDPLKDLEGPVVNAQDPQQLRNLYSVAAGAHLTELDEAVRQIPDWRFRRNLQAFVGALTAVRSTPQPQNPDGSPAGMSPAQLRKIERARTTLEAMLKQLDRAVRKGSA